MIQITLPDGSIREFESGITPMEVAKNISEGFARNVISAKFNTETIETTTPLTTNGNLVLYTWKDDDGASHSHVLQACHFPNSLVNVFSVMEFAKMLKD